MYGLVLKPFMIQIFNPNQRKGMPTKVTQFICRCKVHAIQISLIRIKSISIGYRLSLDMPTK